MTSMQVEKLQQDPAQAAALMPGKGHWARINESTFVAGIRFLFWVCRVFGRWPFRLFLYPVLGWYLMTMPLARAASREYLQRVTALSSARHASGNYSGSGAVFAHFASFAESILDKLLLWSGRFDEDSVTLHGHQLLDDLVAQKKGALLICSHLGNLELCRVLARRRPGLKMTVLMHTRHSQAFNRLLGEIDPASQINLMQVTDMSPSMAMLLSEKVQQGEFVAIAGDRIPVSSNPRVAVARFLGEDAPFPIGPYVMGSLLPCPVFLMFSMNTGIGSEIHFELFREKISLPRKERDQTLAGLAADYAARLEHHCLRTPLQWFNFYDFWRLPDMENNAQH